MRMNMPDNPTTTPVETAERIPAAVSTQLSHGPPANWRLGFWSLIVTQFQGAFNDNALKFLVIYLIVERNFPAASRDRLVLLVGALFALPYILFSLGGGYLADRFSKRSVTIGTKIFELGVMIFAFVSLAVGNLPMEAASVFLISTQGALFGPSKYGLLPELLPEEKLSWGNGVIELGTFLAIIAGTVGGTLLASNFRGHPSTAGIILIVISFFGLATSYGISPVPANAPDRKFQFNFVAEVWNRMSEVRRTDK